MRVLAHGSAMVLLHRLRPTVFTRTRLLLLLMAALQSLAEESPHPGSTGCQQRLSAVCPGWETNKSRCLACVAAHLKQLEPNCTAVKARSKCTVPPTPGPSPAALPSGPLPLPPVAPAEGAPRPHILLFVVDDMGRANIGYQNPENVHTPAFDAEAKRGIILERHYTFRWCAPTRSALMTGRLPYHVFEATTHVDGRMNMIPAKLQQVGYATHQIGKCAFRALPVLLARWCGVDALVAMAMVCGQGISAGCWTG